MEYNLDGMMGFDRLGLSYEAHIAGIDGENFTYSVYFEDAPTDGQSKEVVKAVAEYLKPYEERDVYMGYIDVTRDSEKVSIYLDLGNVQPQYEDVAVKGILQALDGVPGVRSVIVNEGCDFDF
jgi:hypothetical protein